MMTPPHPKGKPSTGSAARGLAAPVYMPWLGMAISAGMVTLALPLYLEAAQLDYLSLSTVLAAAGLGSAVAGVPAGDAVSRFGSTLVMAFGLAAIALTTAVLASTEQFLVLGALQFIAGAGTIALRIGGQTWVTLAAPMEQRGRLLAGMGGLRRFGMFVGPFLAGLLIQSVGFGATFGVAAALAALGVLPLLGAKPIEPPQAAVRLALSRVLALHWRRLLVATSGPVLIMAARRGRAVVLPLIGVGLDLTPTQVGLLVSVGSGADLALFPVSGYLMDRFGRLSAIVPAFSLMAFGLFLLAGATTGATVVIAGSIIGVGNGLSAGTMMTIGADLAPEDSTSQFLAGFASLQDWGQILGPLLVGWVAATIGLGASAAALGITLLVGVALIVLTVGETSRSDVRT